MSWIFWIRVSTAFSYEIDLDALDANGRQAVHDALDGDLSRIEAIHSGRSKTTEERFLDIAGRKENSQGELAWNIQLRIGHDAYSKRGP